MPLLTQAADEVERFSLDYPDISKIQLGNWLHLQSDEILMRLTRCVLSGQLEYATGRTLTDLVNWYWEYREYTPKQRYMLMHLIIQNWQSVDVNIRAQLNL